MPAGAFSDLCQGCQLPEIEIAKARANVDELMGLYRQLYECLPKLKSGKAFQNIALAGLSSLIVEETKQNAEVSHAAPPAASDKPTAQRGGVALH